MQLFDTERVNVREFMENYFGIDFVDIYEKQ